MQKFGLAQNVRRVEDPRLLTGAGRYTDDIVLPNMAHGIVLRSPHAAAAIRAINTRAAAALPGVVAIYTHADLAAERIGTLPCTATVKNRDGTECAQPPHPVLAAGQVRHVGDPVAFIVAETVQAGRDAAEAIQIDYVTEAASSDLATALDANAPRVWPALGSNQVFDWSIGDQAATEAAFAAAAHVTRLRVVNNRIVVASMEARAALADYSNGKWTLHTNSQGGWLIKRLLATTIFHQPSACFRVITPDVGGGFGMKLFLYAEHVLTCFAARALGRPVKWASERSEAFLSDTHGRDNISYGELALDADHTMIALRTRTLANMGAYLSTFAPYIPTGAGTGVLASVYGFRQVYANVIGVFTHTVPVDAYRGAGRPESNYLVERLIDTAAAELGIDRVVLRRRNFVPPSAMPYRTPVGKLYDSGDFAQVLDAALQSADWAGFEVRRAEAAQRGRKRGIGLAYYLEATGGAASERAEIRFHEDGLIDVYVGTQSTGQGHETAYAMLTADRLGVPGERIRIHQGDTDIIPIGGGTGGARSLYSEGTAITATALAVIERGKQAACEALEATPAEIGFAGGQFTVIGTNRRIGILDLARAQHQRQRAGEAAILLEAAQIAAIPAHTFPNGCHIAEIEIDPETGHLAIVRYCVTDDVGRAINPTIVRGQVHGGVAQGVGQAVLERTVYEPGSGQLLSGSFMDYAVPRASDLPDIEVALIEVPCGTNPLGVKGAGEAGAIGSPPAMINAIIDALRGDGITTIDMPVTPERLWKALHRVS